MMKAKRFTLADSETSRRKAPRRSGSGFAVFAPVLFVFVFLCAFLAAFPAPAKLKPTDAEPAEIVPLGDSDEPSYEGGEYIISNARQFAVFRDWINENKSADKTFCLKGHIDLGDVLKEGEDWIPIGARAGEDGAYCFSGIFKGNGHTVSGLRIVSEDYPYEYAGLFGYLKGTITSLDVTGFVVSVKRKAGGGEGHIYAGGLAGCMEGGRIEDSCAVGEVFASSETGYAAAGGLVGEQLSGRIRAGYATGGVSASSSSVTGSAAAGGLVGIQRGKSENQSVIEAGYATGGVSASSAGSVVVGGLVGEQDSGGRVEAGYAAGGVSGSGSASVYAGGLVGFAEGTVSNSVFDTQGTGREKGIGGGSAGAAGRSTREMTTAGVLSALGDAQGTVWIVVEGYYPQLISLVQHFSRDSAFSAVPVWYAEGDTSQRVTQPFSVPKNYLYSGSTQALTWSGEPDDVLDIEADPAPGPAPGPRQAAPGAAADDSGWPDPAVGERRITPKLFDKDVLLTVAYTLPSPFAAGAKSQGSYKRSFALKTAAVSPDPPGPDPEPGYGISLDVAGVYVFPEAAEGYGIVPHHKVTVTNTGDQPTGPLSVRLSGDYADAFTLSSVPLDSIGVGGRSAFTVAPAAGLPEGTYTAAVTVGNEDNGITANFGLSFTVVSSGPAPVPDQYFISFSLNMTVGESRILEALLSPDSAGEGVYWNILYSIPSSPDSAPGAAVVEISDDGAAPDGAERELVKAVSPGTALIAAWTSSGEFSALCAVAVVPAASDDPVVIVEEKSGGCRGPGSTGGGFPLLLAAALIAAARRARGPAPITGG